MLLIQTLTFGLKKPETGDKGATVFNALEDNITQLDPHEHDGATSKRVENYNTSRGTIAVTNASWVADGNLFKKTVTLPAGFNDVNGSKMTQASLRFYFDGGTYDKQECFPKYERLTDTTFELYSIYNDQAYTVTLV